VKLLEKGRVVSMMKYFAFVIALASAACGSKQSTPVASSGGDTPGATDTRTAIEKRRDAACETLGPRITTCAVEDAKQAKEAGQITQAQYDDITKREVLAKNTEEFVDSCKKPKTPYSSRQIRVLEVCPKEESDCDPLMACLDHLDKP
jgi:hypothetical protein